jgi:hypothetical protein
MTPKRNGIWKDMEATTRINEADYYVIFDGHNEKIDESRAIYFCQHPRIENVAYNTHENLGKSFKSYNGKKCLKAFNSENALNPGEWWLSYDYDYLNSLEKPSKTKLLSCIMTYQTHNPMYNQRVLFMENFAEKVMFRSDISWDLYGRPEDKFKNNDKLNIDYHGSLGANNPDGSLGVHTIGKEILKDYLYDLMFDVGPTKNYVSERFNDALLLWCKPIYFGSNNVHEFFPQESFDYVNILNLNEWEKVVEVIKKPINYEAIKEARNLVLNKYQVWPYVYNVIKEL